ncbi:wrky transcription factor 44 [Quercus suber]|uniref:Wrky transcription factor 44 n=1 Tax=Quercus suber TaxID=58331 RepID=A0AAW0IXD1_QUESU
MDTKEAERIVIAKPVASRPTCSTFRSFSELLAGAINASPSNVCSETAVAAIRPKTVRFKPMVNHGPAGLVSSQAEISGTAVCNSSDKVLKLDSKSTVVYKPLAKLASKRTVSLLANMGNFNTSLQQPQPSVDASVQHPNQEKHNFRPRLSTNLHQNNPSYVETNRTVGPSKIASQNLEEDAKALPPTANDTNTPLWANHNNEGNESSEGRVENQNEVGLSAPSTYPGKAIVPFDPVSTGTINAGGGTPDNSCGLSGECEEGSRAIEPEDDEPRSKRRKSENQSNEAGIPGEGVQEPRIVVQNSTDTEITTDGFRWRKYGQKVVKGNPYPRSYYRCTSLKCNVRKHVERASDDPRAFITTYEGKHNHEMPVKNTNPVASETDSLPPKSKDKR